MEETYVLTAYWAPRKESINECADRLHKFFADLITCDFKLSTWYEGSKSRNQAVIRPAAIDKKSYLVDLLNRGQNRRDVGGVAIKELGFRAVLWNGGNSKEEALLSVTCGLYWQSPRSSASMSNYVILEFPEDLGDLCQTESMASVLVAVARAWQPDWAGVMSRNAMTGRSFSAKVPFADWMLFIPRKIANVSPPSTIKELEGLGSLVIIQSAPPSGKDPSEMARIREIQRGALS